MSKPEPIPLLKELVQEVESNAARLWKSNDAGDLALAAILDDAGFYLRHVVPSEDPPMHADLSKEKSPATRAGREEERWVGSLSEYRATPGRSDT